MIREAVGEVQPSFSEKPPLPIWSVYIVLLTTPCWGMKGKAIALIAFSTDGARGSVNPLPVEIR